MGYLLTASARVIAFLLRHGRAVAASYPLYTECFGACRLVSLQRFVGRFRPNRPALVVCYVPHRAQGSEFRQEGVHHHVTRLLLPN